MAEWIDSIVSELRKRGKELVSLDTPENPDGVTLANDIAAGFTPGLGTVMSLRDYERARREGDYLGMGLSALGMIPLAGGVTKGISKLRTAKAADVAADVAKKNTGVSGGAIAEKLNAKYGDLVDAYIGEGKNISLNKIVVPAESRNQGIGSRFMQDLIDAADEERKVVTLTPSSDFGGSKGKLQDFYSRFGFVQNKGKNKDFSISDGMYRLPQELRNAPSKTEFEIAHEVAQRNAALPVEKGGLGLPPNNTAMDRAKKMGFDAEVYHGTKSPDIEQFIPSKGGEFSGGVYTSSDPLTAAQFAAYSRGDGGENIIPLLSRAQSPLVTNDRNVPRAMGVKTMQKKGYDSVIGTTPSGQVQNVIFDPSMLRSRFAAFDPLKKDSTNILAGTAATAITIPALIEALRSQEQPQTK